MAHDHDHECDLCGATFDTEAELNHHAEEAHDVDIED